jgi:hypothetical protein
MKINQAQQQQCRLYEYKRQIEQLGKIVEKINHQHDDAAMKQRKIARVLTPTKVDLYA